MIQILLNLLPTIIISAVSFLAGAFLTWYFMYRTLANAVKCLLRDRILQAYAYHITNKNPIGHEEYTAFCDMAKAYEGLKGGNGYLEKVIKDFKEAPTNGSI